ncbi:CPBP family glutamic-type intramembrane protease [Runella sp.]|jgi:hypothetical protein|uniref:CPBP family glutamic-type intramembrane protease n=1 Tax=Runella sp. TaxID=1960881 RepID=UPI002637E547|nr:CPBP family glutamic-type intramembrane protease [Runella sp.]
MFYKYSKWLIGLNFIKTVVYFEIINEIISAIFPILAWLTNAGKVFEASNFESLTKDIIVSIIIAPIIETLIAQYLPYIVLRFFTKNLYIIYTISSIIFALGHTYNTWYMVATFFIGIIFIGLFAVLSKKSMAMAFWGVVIVHAISNTIAVIYGHI